MAVNDIANHFIRTYEANVIELVQQKGSKLRRTVTEHNIQRGDSHSFRVVGPRGAMTSRNTASGSTPGLSAFKRTATPYVDTPMNDRIVGSVPYAAADSYSRAEMERLLEDPQSIMLQAQANQVGRQFDDVILAAVLANATDNLSTVLAFLAANQIGGANVSPGFELVKSAREQILEADIDPDEEVFLVVSPNFITSLLGVAEYGSQDYVNARAIQDGKPIGRWMGFSWIVSNRLTHPVVGPPAETYAVAYTKDAIGLKVVTDIHVDVGPDPAHWFDWTCMTSIDIGATRIQDGKAWRFHYLETN